MDNLQFSESLLVLRIATLAILYLFVLQVVLVARRDLQTAPAAMGQAVKAVIGHLVVVDSGKSPLTPGSRLDVTTLVTFGRGPTNTIVLDSPVISTEHTRLYFQNRSLWVEDLQSKNGTFVNERPVVAPVALRPGDILRVGDVRFKLTT